jgi:hypothetical protein
MNAKWLALSAAAALAAVTLLAPAGTAAGPCSPEIVTDGLGCPQWYASFKVLPTDPSQHNPQAYDDVTGPTGQEGSLPCSSDVPAQLCGVSDIVVKTNLASDGVPAYELARLTPTTVAIMDTKVYASCCGSLGADTPAAYLVAQETGQPITPANQHVFVYFGYYDPAVYPAGSAIRDLSCPGNDWNFCPPQNLPQDGAQQDNFIWRGSNTAETNFTQGWGWEIPGQYDPGTQPQSINTNPTSGGFGVGPVLLGGGLSGDCHLYSSQAAPGQGDDGCVSPVPSYTISDTTNDSSAAGGGWVVGNNFDTIPVTDALVTNHYDVNIIGPSSGSNSIVANDYYQVNPQLTASAPGFFLTVNWYQSVSNDALTPLYLTAAHAARDNYNDLQYNVIAPLNQQTASLQDLQELCPTHNLTGSVGVCEQDITQRIAAQNHARVNPSLPATVDNPFMNAYLRPISPITPVTPGSDFDTYWCMQAGAPASACQTVNQTAPGSCCLTGWINPTIFVPLGGNGFTGFEPASTELWGDFIAWTWQDVNGDGFIGNPYPDEIAGYNSGMYQSANIAHTTATPDIVTYQSLAWVGQGVGGLLIQPDGNAGWPPGTILDQGSASGVFEGAPLGNPSEGSHFTPVFGNTPVKLRALDTQALCIPTGDCLTQDGITVPTGTALGIHGYTGSVTMTWLDPVSGSQYTYTQNATFDQSLAGTPPQTGQGFD